MKNVNLPWKISVDFHVFLFIAQGVIKNSIRTQMNFC